MRSEARNRVLLFRSPREPDPYVNALSERGYAAECIPVLHFGFMNEELLELKMGDADQYGALVLTSPRAATALLRLEIDLSAWSSKPAFVVGSETARLARQAGLQPVAEDCGSAERLAAILAKEPRGKPLLFLAGDRRRNELPDTLRECQIPFEELIVYRTILDHPILQEHEKTAWCVFFSPSGVEAVAGAEILHDTRIAAIGRTTAEALEASGLHPLAIAAAPEPAALVDAIRNADETHG